MMDSIKILDSTLREGEQSPGVIFSPIEKLIILKKLLDLPLWCVEIGLWDTSEINNIIIKKLVEYKKLYCEKRSHKESIGVSVLPKIDSIKSLLSECKPDIVFMIVPVSNEITSIYNIHEKAIKCIEYIKDEYGTAFISESTHVALMDASKPSDFSTIRKYFELGIKNYWIADSFGFLRPQEVKLLLDQIGTYIDLKTVNLGSHCHNDLGLALANTYEFVRNGAYMVSSCLNGLGDRVGVTCTEEVLYNFMPGQVDLIDLRKISKILERYSGIKCGDNKPIVSDHITTHETGIHLDLIRKKIKTHPFDIEDKLIQISSKTGRSSLKMHLEGKGISLNENEFDLIKFFIKNDASTFKKKDIDTAGFDKYDELFEMLYK